MSAGRAERILVQHLCDFDSLTTLAKEGLSPEFIVSEELRPVYNFAIDYFWRNGMSKAPSVETLVDEYGTVLADAEIEMDHEPDDSVEYAIDSLKGSWVNREGQEFIRDFAESLASAESRHRPEVVNNYSGTLVRMAATLDRRNQKSDAREDLGIRLLEFDKRAADRDSFHGLRFGIGPIDEHVHGVHPGELAVLAAPPKVGKSFALLWSALQHWEAGGSPLIFTLENSVEMQLDRLVCMAANVDYRRWQRGICGEEELQRVRDQLERFRSAANPLWIFQPDLGKRNVETMVAQAGIYEADALYIDQLTFVELPEGNRPKHERMGEALHALKGLISTGRHPIPCLLAHQINREGQKAAEKVGRLEMYHMAEAAEVERTADLVCGLYASNADQIAQRVLWQILAMRRDQIQNWQLSWNPSIGAIRALTTVTLAA
jgi:replicative DNA helicase